MQGHLISTIRHRTPGAWHGLCSQSHLVFPSILQRTARHRPARSATYSTQAATVIEGQRDEIYFPALNSSSTRQKLDKLIKRETQIQNANKKLSSILATKSKQKHTAIKARTRSDRDFSVRGSRSRGTDLSASASIQLKSSPSKVTHDAHLYKTKSEIITEFEIPIRDDNYRRLVAFPLEVLQDTGRFNKVSIFGNTSSPDRRTTVHHIRATAKFQINGAAETFVGYGSADSQKSAQSTAWLHIIGLISRRTGLEEFIGTSYNRKDITDDFIKNEKTSKMEIYEYCAAYDGIPEFSYRRIPRNRQFEITIKFPPQSIRVMIRHHDPALGDTIASVLFKKQAEQWHAKNADSSLQVKNVLSLNSTNARQFFDLCKKERIIGSYECCSPKDKTVGIKGLHAAQIFVDGAPYGEVVHAASRKSAEGLAYLTAGIKLRQAQPEPFSRFLEALKIGKGEILKSINPLWFRTKWEYLQPMADTVNLVRRIGFPRDYSSEPLSRADATYRKTRSFSTSNLNTEVLKAKSSRLSQSLNHYHENDKLKELRAKRKELPMNQFASKVLSLVNENTVSIIVGATGSGKTTQVPQIIFEDAIKKGNGANCNILCTQPRRIAATSVAERVAFERNEPLRQTVGYHVRFNAKLAPPLGSINFCTTGILLQQLRADPEGALRNITHILVDEVHERDVQIDFLMVLLKRVMRQREKNNLPPLKVVLMSATMNTELFASYFASRGQNGVLVDCPSLSVPGRTFPVTEYFLDDVHSILRSKYSAAELHLLKDSDTKDFIRAESQFSSQVLAIQGKQGLGSQVSKPIEDDTFIDWKRKSIIGEDGEMVISNDKEDGLVPCGLAATVIAHLAMTTQEGDILAFFPGLQEIQTVNEMLRTQRPLGLDFERFSNYRIDILHSSLPQQQMDVFQADSEGKRRIILSTNIAETSVTIPEVRYVVDSGKLREKRYEQTSRITKLQCTWVSKSNSKQRAGRAGRVRNGNYFALFSKERFGELRPSGLPEILRSDLQEVCLDIRAQGFEDPIANFLSEAIEPPSPIAIEAALSQLQGLGAFDRDDNLTNLGRVLATLPVEPALGKMILLGVIFKCLDPMIILGACGSARDIFVSPLDKKREAHARKKLFAQDTGSDHMAILNAFREWRMRRDNEGMFALARFTDENYLHRGALRVIDQTANQIEEILCKAGIIPFSSQSGRLNGEYGDSSLNENSASVPLIKALSLAGTYPNVAIALGGLGHRTMEENFVMIHPGSVNYTGKSGNGAFPRDTVISFGSKAKSTDGRSVYMRDVTQSSILNAILFGGRPTQSGTTLVFDGWIPISFSDERALKAVAQFRLVLDKVLNHVFQNISAKENISKGNTSKADISVDRLREEVLNGVVKVLEKYAQHGVSNTSVTSFRSLRPTAAALKMHRR